MTESDLKRFKELIRKHSAGVCTPGEWGELIALCIRIVGRKLLGDLSELGKRLDTLERRIDALVDKEGEKVKG